MSKQTYSLQVPISKELEFKLKALANDEERTLRVFCRRVLQAYVNECDFDFSKLESKEEVENKEKKVEKVLEVVEVNEPAPPVIEPPLEQKKPKIGGFGVKK